MKILKRINRRVVAEEKRMILHGSVAMAPRIPESEVAGFRIRSAEAAGSHKEVEVAEMAMAAAESCNEQVAVVVESCSKPVVAATEMEGEVENSILEEVEAMAMVAASIRWEAVATEMAEEVEASTLHTAEAMEVVVVLYKEAAMVVAGSGQVVAASGGLVVEEGVIGRGRLAAEGNVGAAGVSSEAAVVASCNSREMEVAESSEEAEVAGNLVVVEAGTGRSKEVWEMAVAAAEVGSILAAVEMAEAGVESRLVEVEMVVEGKVEVVVESKLVVVVTEVVVMVVAAEKSKLVVEAKAEVEEESKLAEEAKEVVEGESRPVVVGARE